MRKISKRQQAEDAAQAFIRQTVCQECELDAIGNPDINPDKESFTFQGRTIYYCPKHSTFQHYYFDLGANKYWRRKGEMEQN